MLKDKETGEIGFVIVFSLVTKEEVEREAQESGKKDEERKEDQSRGGFTPGADDLD